MGDVKLCDDCHHSPSRGGISNDNPHGLWCYCKCHDLADAAPELLELLRLSWVVDADLATRINALLARFPEAPQ